MTTPHQSAEAELIAYGLTLPETEAGQGWAFTRVVRVRGKMFVILSAAPRISPGLTLGRG